VLENVSMRERKVPSAAAIRRLRKSKPVDLPSFEAQPTRRAGQFLGDRYRIEGLLGTGGTSNVYLAVDTRIGHSVVIKELNRSGASNEGIRARFLSEAEVLANFQHPRIMRVLDFSAAGAEPPYLVTEALVGETLTALLQRQPVLPLDIALLIARQTAQGLLSAHRRGLVHRDIKPDNLFLLGPRGAPFGLKLIDFGMAHLSTSNDTSGVHTVLGTIEYMAPEQAMADPVDVRTDIYGFGIVLFRLFTGHLPFESPEGLDLLSHQLFSPVPSASWFDDAIDPRIDAVITRATRKHPDNRYPNMRAMMIDLDVIFGLCHGDPTSTALVVDPDVYYPQSEKGREVAALLAARFNLGGRPQNARTEEAADRSSISTAKKRVPGVAESTEFEDVSGEEIELCEA
jgi:eukaryotic-like serine/threonine-protein kinase